MLKLSRGALAAIAVAVAVPAGVAIAHSYDRHGGWHRMSPEARQRLDEGRLAMAKTALKLNADQEKLWSALETEIRAGFKMRADRMAEREAMREERRKARQDGDGKADAAKRPDISERFEKMGQRMGERAERMKAFSAAFKPFYASLSDEQKEVLRPLMREMMPGGGRGHGGKRWAHGGEDRGWGHHGGWGRHHEGRGRGDMDEGGGGGGPGRDAERGPPAEQLMPEADEASPVAPDNL